MPNVTFEKTGNVTGRITVNITKQELNDKLTAELKKQRGKVSMKGFRKGKTPVSALRKMMGNQVLGQILDEEIRESLFGHIEENDIKLIFSPRPVENNQPTITATALADLELLYDLALEPEFELVLPEKTYEKLVLDTSEAFLDEQVEKMRKRAGESQEVEDGTVEDEDIVDVTIREDGPLEDKIENETKLYIESLSDEGKALLLGKKTGDVIENVDLTTLEKNSSPTFVNKYLLDLEDADTDLSGKTFSLTIDTINRVVPAELDEEFYTKFDASGEVTNEGELRERIARDNASGFNKQGEAMLNVKIQKDLVENTDIELPLELMKEVHSEEGSGSFEQFQRGVKWMLIRNKFAADNEVKLEYDDVRAEAVESLMGMLGGQRPDFLTDEFIDNYVGQMLQDEKQREQLSSNAVEKKIMAAISRRLNVEDKPLDADGFNEAIKAFNEEFAEEE